MSVHVAPVDVVLGVDGDGDEDDQREQQKSELSIQHRIDLDLPCFSIPPSAVSLQ